MSGDDGTIKLDEDALMRDPDEVFEILEKLGEGAYGAVYKGLHKASGKLIAIKQVLVDSDLQDIVKEISIMQQCENNFIVKYFGSYFKRSDLWIIMEYCAAGSVSDIIRFRNKTLKENEIAPIVKSTLKGLEYLHSKRKIHRDIKAGNILLNQQGEAKLADFGVAGQLSDTMAKRNTVIGTPFWMAPEVIQEIGYDCLADIWSLGITAIEMAEGRPPHADIHPMRAIFMIPTKPPPTLHQPDDWSDAFKAFVAACLVKNPEERASAVALLQHAFVAAADTTSPELLAAIEEAMQRRREQPASPERAEGEGEGPAGEGAVQTIKPATSVPQDTMVPRMDSLQTLVVGESDSSTIKRVDMDDAAVGDGYKPAFMAHFENINAESGPAPPPAVAAPIVTVDELRRRLAALESDMQREMEELHKLYEAKRQPILAAISAKQIKP
eukprot:m.168528 g.168528  ORF g.168528 m.168528 type:complete len:440 (+) comp9910_c1_seq9:5217-6536(+)